MHEYCQAPILKLFEKVKDPKQVDMTELLTLYKKSYSKDDLVQVSDLILQCLKWLPNTRITAEEATSHPFFKEVKPVQQKPKFMIEVRS